MFMVFCQVPKEELEKRIAATKEAWLSTRDPATHPAFAWTQYQYSMHIKGENSLENAKALGALNVRELYPDITPTTLEHVAKEFYTPGWAL